MSRSGYSEDCDSEWDAIRWRGAVSAAIKGARGQAFLREALAALDAMPEKRLIAHELEMGGAVCTIGAVGVKRGVEMGAIDPEDYRSIARAFGIASALAQEVMFYNDEYTFNNETPEHRFGRMREWVSSRIKPEAVA